MKKSLIGLLLVVVLLLSALISCAPANEEDYAEAAAAVYTIDVNPGVRVFVDTEGKVISVEATNDDGEAIVAELNYEGVPFEDVTEQVVDALSAAGYLDGEESSVLISLEKAEIEISERLNAKIDEAFEKHGKVASIIEQNLGKLDAEIDKAIEDIAREHHISKGKAHIIERIREEFPELSEEELAELSVEELRMLLEDTTDDIKRHFDKLGELALTEYKSREEAILAAVASLDVEFDLTDITNLPVIKVRATNRDGKMLYSVEIIYNGMKYELLLDAKTGEVVKSEEKEHEAFDPEAMIDEFFKNHGIDGGSLKDHFHGLLKPDGTEEHKLTKGEIISLVLEKLGIDENTIEDTEVEFHGGRGDVVVRVEIVTEGGNSYELVLEAFSGAVIKAELNGEPLPTENGDAA